MTQHLTGRVTGANTETGCARSYLAVIWRLPDHMDSDNKDNDSKRQRQRLEFRLVSAETQAAMSCPLLHFHYRYKFRVTRSSVVSASTLFILSMPGPSERLLLHRRRLPLALGRDLEALLALCQQS
jgi:hypothetical protein